MDWLKVDSYHVGGTTCVGFSADGVHLMSVSHSGRGVFHIASGKRVARDNEDFGSWHRDVEVDGIGPLKGQVVPVFGIFSDIPQQILDELRDFDLTSHITAFKGAALSPDNQFLAIGYSDEIQIYKRT